MDDTIRHLCRAALEAVDTAGPAGISRRALLELTRIRTCHLITTAEEQELLKTLTEKLWVQTYTDPIIDEMRYVVTGLGKLAKGHL